MAKILNSLWRFFASIKLALISLFILAAVSIIGTLVKQGEATTYYVQEYGPSLARIIEMLDISNMYHSWWFAALLCFFAVNLVVCSIKRLPDVWRIVVQDNLSIDPRRLEKMSLTYRTDMGLLTAEAADLMQQSLVHAGWRKPRRLDSEGYSLLFAQQGAWTRLGVYIVHLSILIILLGVIIGTIIGYKAYVFLPEGRSANTVFLQGSGEPVPLGFEVACDRMELTYYPNGMVKQSRVDLTVNDPQLEAPLQKSTIVNDPLSYRGLTFYQADSYPLDEFFLVIRNHTTGMEQAFRIPPERDVTWPGTDISFRIEETRQNEDGAVQQARIHFSANGAAAPENFWVKDNGTVTVRQAGEEFSISFRQLNTILFLVTKDPGVMIVYLGCILMLLGLSISFFLSHKRIWISIKMNDEQGTRILISGTTNKNKPAFAKRFQELGKQVSMNTADSVGEKSS